MKYLRLALTLMTILPAGRLDEPQPGDTGRASIWFPVTGAIIGLVTFAGWYLFKLILPPAPAAMLTLVIWVALSGGLHLDGLADCCDGLISAARPERRLEIMADPHVGTFGMLGLILALGLKVSAIYSLSTEKALFVFIFAACFSHWLVMIAAKQPLARKEGMAADLAAGLETGAIFAAAVLPFILMVIGGWPAALSAALASLTAAVIFAFAGNRIGGITGDVMGLTIEIAEIVILLTYAAL
jgi:adenosylcobinamide-GDP ribazoletransferase